MLSALGHSHLRAQQITTQAPPEQATSAPTLPDDPDRSYPIAQVVIPPASPDSPTIESDTQSYHAGLYVLDGTVVITYKDRIVHADHIEYDTNSGELNASGHLLVTGGTNQEHLSASHGTFNLRTSTGRFSDVSGSVGVVPASPSHLMVYTSSNPFLFTGRLVVKTGPRNYDVYDGTVTSCQFSKPDWILSAAHFSVDDNKASAHNSVFRLLNLPLVYLPYVTHSLDAEDRQSGFMIPVVSQSNTKGIILGEQIYFAINRSTDLTVGAEYFSLRGFSQMVNFRHRGRDLDFLNIHYTGLLDRRTGLQNQGGEDLTFAGRHDFSSATRVAANVEYLSSYVYRQAFTDNFNQAVTSDIVSTAYGSHHINGLEFSALADRYQGIKFIGQNTVAQQQVRIFHAPSLSVSSTEHTLARSHLQLSFEASTSGLKRSQPNFATGGIVERVDLHPRMAYPFSLGAWRIRPSFAAHETLYSRSRLEPKPNRPPIESLSGLSRSALEFDLNLRAPVLTRTFQPTRFSHLLGSEVRHTISPELNYRLRTGVANFSKVLRFDSVDIASNTHEAEYGVTQRLFRRHSAPAECHPPDLPLSSVLDSEPTAPEHTSAPVASCGDEELLSWRLTQKYFFDPSFGGAVVRNRRNIFESTLDLSGIAFLTEPREISPLVSRLRVRTSAKTDFEWDFDLDTGARHFTSSNVFLDLHQGNTFAALSYARLDAPGRSYTQGVNSSSSPTGVSSSISDFNQLRFLIGYGNPSKQGLSVGANTGLDLKSLYGTTSTTTTPTGTFTTTVYPALLQYTAIQTSYNWNCCGLSVEYRKFELGSVRNENVYRFNFTLANVGTAGNLRRAERLF